MQAIASNRRLPERWRKRKHKRLLVIYKSKKQVYKNPRALDYKDRGRQKPDHFDPHLHHFQEAF